MREGELGGRGFAEAAGDGFTIGRGDERFDEGTFQHVGPSIPAQRLAGRVEHRDPAVGVGRRDQKGAAVEQRLEQLLAAPSTHHRSHGRDEFRGICRIEQIGIRAALEAPHAMFGVGERGRYLDDAGLIDGQVRLDPARQRVAIAIGQDDVGEDHVGPRPEQRFPRRARADRVDDPEASRLQRAAPQDARRGAALDEQDRPCVAAK